MKKKNLFGYMADFFKFCMAVVIGFLGLIYKTAEFIVKKLEKRSKNIEEKKLEAEKSKSGFENFREVENIKGSIGEFEKNLYTKKSTIGLILGARGSGKSAAGMRILENFASKTNRKLYAIGFERASLPKWIHIPDSVKDIGEDSFVLIDEAGIEFSSRNSMKNANKILSEIILISRHKNLSILFISQNSSNIEINTIRQSDYLVLKKPSLLQLDFERKKITEIYLGAGEKFKKYENEPGIAYIYSDWYCGFVINGLPSFWSDGLSKSYRKR